MLSFFQKRPAQKEIINKLELLPLQFTMEQKSAIMVSLLALARDDEYIPDKRFRYLERLLALLKIDNNSWLFKEVYDAGLEKSLLILRKLWGNQKEWYVMMIYGLKQMGNQTSKNEEFSRVFAEIDISRQRYQHITKRFK